MSNKDLHIIAVLDRSGSMAGLIEEMRKGFNSLKAEELKKEGETFLTVTIFDTVHDRLYTGADAKFVPDLTSDVYYARGGTALLDAVGKTLTEAANLRGMPKKTLVVIATDGYENSSIEWTKERLKALIDKQQNKKRNPWTFIFMGAGVDAFSDRFGFVRTTSTINVTPDWHGTQILYASVGSASTGLRDAVNSQTYNSTMDISGASNVNYGNNPTVTNIVNQPAPKRARRSKTTVTSTP